MPGVDGYMERTGYSVKGNHPRSYTTHAGYIDCGDVLLRKRQDLRSDVLVVPIDNSWK